MKTKDRGLAQTLLLNVCDAPKAQVGQIAPLGRTVPSGRRRPRKSGVCASRNWRCLCRPKGRRYARAAMILYSLFTPASVKSRRECWAQAYAPARFGEGSVTQR